MAGSESPSGGVVDTKRAIAYLLIGVASAGFVVFDVVPILCIWRNTYVDLSPSPSDRLGLGVWMAFFGVPLAYLVGSRHRAAAGCLGFYVVMPWMCCGTCIGMVNLVDVTGLAWFALPLLQAIFIVLAVLTVDQLFASAPNKVE